MTAKAKARVRSGATPTLLGTLSVCATLYFGRDVLIPLALASLIAFVLAPLVRRLERRRIPRTLAVIIVGTLAAVPLISTGWVVVSQGASLVESFPEYRETLRDKIEGVRSLVAGTMSRASGVIGSIQQSTEPAAGPAAQSEPMPVTIVESPGIPIAGRFMWPILGPIATLSMVMVFAAFILLERDQIRDKIIALLNRKHLTVTSHAIDEVTERVGRYLRMQLLLNACNAVVTAIALTLFGVPNAILWGILGGILRFVPYIGPLIGALFPICFAIVISDSWSLPLSVAAFYIVLELIGNVVEPLVQRSSTGVTSLALIIAATFWAWIWGVPGLLLSTPITVCLVVAGQHARPLRWLNILMADQTPLTPSESLYRNLISVDTGGSPPPLPADPGTSLAEVADALLFPALTSARLDLERGDLEEPRYRAATEGVRELVDASFPTKAPVNSALPAVLCIPAYDDADAAAAHVLAASFNAAGTPAFALTIDDLGSPIQAIMQRTGAAHACIISLPPFASARARIRARQLILRAPDVKPSVLLISRRQLTPAALSALTQAGAVRVFTTAAEAVRAAWSPHAMEAQPIAAVTSDT